VRQTLQIGTAGFALLLRYLTWWEAAVLAGAAMAFSRYALPRMGGRNLLTEAERRRGYSVGLLLSPLAILILLFSLPHRLDIVAAAWGILAVGDGMAAIAGTRLGGPRIPWNPDKTLAGSLAFCVCGGAAGALLAWWCRPALIPPPYVWFSLGAPFAAAAVAALVETVPIRLDDNLTVPLTAAAVLWPASLMSADMMASATAHALQTLPTAIATNAAVAAIGYGARTVSPSGAIVGTCIGVVIFVTTGWQGWMLLMATFMAASVSTRVGLRRKTGLGIAEERGGRRGGTNAVANTGVAAIAAVMAATTYATAPAMVGFVTALTAGGSDTVASEIGKAFGGRTWIIPKLRTVTAGTPGAVSIAGTAAGVMAAVALGGLGVGLGLVRGSVLVAIVAGATLGAFAESALSATFEHRGILNNDLLNFLNTAIAAAAAIALAGVL
jgi:uncharacterized protein (TIGR00297 family)